MRLYPDLQRSSRFYRHMRYCILDVQVGPPAASPQKGPAIRDHAIVRYFHHGTASGGNDRVAQSAN